jgi:hypothetical protein
VRIHNTLETIQVITDCKMCEMTFYCCNKQNYSNEVSIKGEDSGILIKEGNKHASERHSDAGHYAYIYRHSYYQQLTNSSLATKPAYCVPTLVSPKPLIHTHALVCWVSLESVTSKVEMRNSHKILVGKSARKRSLWDVGTERRIKLKRIWKKWNVDWIQLPRYEVYGWLLWTR